MDSMKNLIAAVMNAAAAKLHLPGLPTTSTFTGPYVPFVQHKNPEANKRRKIKKLIGARQFKKQIKVTRRYDNARRADLAAYLGGN